MNIYKFLGKDLEDSEVNSIATSIFKIFNKNFTKELITPDEMVEFFPFVERNVPFCLFIQLKNFIHFKESSEKTSDRLEYDKDTGFYEFNINHISNPDEKTYDPLDKIILPESLVLLMYNPFCNYPSEPLFLEKCKDGLGKVTTPKTLTVDTKYGHEDIYFNDKDIGYIVKFNQDDKSHCSLLIRTFVLYYKKYSDIIGHDLLTSTSEKEVTGILDEPYSKEEPFDINLLCDSIYQELSELDFHKLNFKLRHVEDEEEFQRIFNFLKSKRLEK